MSAAVSPLAAARTRVATVLCATTRRLATGTSLDFDHACGVDTAGGIPAERLFAGNRKASAGCLGYEGVPVRHFAHMMRFVPAPLADWSFIDIGSGKGRAVLLAAGYPFRKVIGVELAPELHLVAQSNVDRYRGPRHCGEVELRCADATGLDLPPGDIVIFFFSPFRGELVRRLLDSLQARLEAEPRRLLFIYSNPLDRAIVDAHPAFTHIADTVSPFDPIWWGNRRSVVYRAGTPLHPTTH